MADDQNKHKLNMDLDQVNDGLLKDVRDATEQVKQRQASDRAKDAAEAKKGQSRRTSALLVAIGAVLVFLLSYWMVFGRQGGSVDSRAGGGGGPASTVQVQSENGKIKPPCVTPSPAAPPKAAPPVGRDSQTVQHPPEGYEQPSYDPGM